MRRLAALMSLTALLACGESETMSPPPGTDGGPPASGILPCDIDRVLAENCRGCHGAETKFGAPMSLETYADTQASAKSDPGKRVYELMKLRINDPENPMPPSGALLSDELGALNAWLDGGAAPGSEPSCTPVPTNPKDANIGPDKLPCTPSQTFTAHADGSQAGFKVPENANNLYQCFTFKSPFNGTEQGTAWAPIVDDERVLHHWILYRTKTPQAENGVMPCQMPQDSLFVAGWAPGGENYLMPDDVGLELPGPDDWLILQIHYYNVPRYDDAEDKSGVALCTTDTPRQNKAGVYTLGTLRIDIPPNTEEYETSGLCGTFLTRFLPQPVSVIASFPHMHQLGTRFKTEVLRGSNTGPSETLIEVERWDFDNQKFYPHSPPFILNPGDAIRTTCTYHNPTSTRVRIGEGTDDEMCFNFVLVYPIELFMGQRQCGLL